MSGYRVLVADDEPLARRMVAMLVRDDPEVAEVIECADAVSVIRAIEREPVDIAFLDIEMPEMTGLDVAGRFTPERPVVVFITAFSAYAAGAFEVRAVDYVLKPFSEARFREAFERAKARVRERVRRQDADRERPARSDPPSRFLQRLSFRDGGQRIVVRVEDIVRVEAQDYYVLVHTRSGRHLLRAALAALDQRLDPARFLRVHRGALVNLSDVVSIDTSTPMTVTLSDGAVVPVSRARRRAVLAALESRFR